MRQDAVEAVVFGGASGLGEATARRLAAGGARVLVADLAVDRAREVAADIGGEGLECDVTDERSVELVVERTSELRIAVTCAGIGTPTKLLGRDGPTALDTFRRVIDVNLVGTINTIRLCAAAMRRNRPDGDGQRGVCVNTASIAAFDGQIGQVAYSAAKGGIVGLTLPVARELAAHGIRVVTVAPGLFNTPLLASLPQAAQDSLAASVPFPPRLGDPAEFAALVDHVITNTMLNGEAIRLDGALRMAPR